MVESRLEDEVGDKQGPHVSAQGFHGVADSLLVHLRQKVPFVVLPGPSSVSKNHDDVSRSDRFELLSPGY